MELPESARAIVESGELAHLVTRNPDGSPQISCVWVGIEGGEIVSGHLRASFQKLRNVRRDPRVALSIADERNPYHNAQIRGRVVETVDGDEALEIIDRLAVKYTGRPFPMRSGRVYMVEAEKVQQMTLPFTHTPQ